MSDNPGTLTPGPSPLRGEGKVYEVVDAFHERLLKEEAAQMEEMARRWLEVERRLEGDMTALVYEMMERKAKGLPVTGGMVMRMERYEALLMQTGEEVRRYGRWSARMIEGEQVRMWEMGEDLAEDMVTSAVRVDWNRLSAGAVEEMAGFAGSGKRKTPLLSVLMRDYPETVERLTSSLLEGVALGWNPRKTARAMQDAMAGNLERALVVARTEQLRAFREATRRSYQANADVVGGWVWHAALDDRTCAICWAMHGSKHGVDERLISHPCCRCAMVPMTKTWEELGKELGIDLSGIPETRVEVRRGEDVLRGKSEDFQQEVLGEKRWAAWKDGARLEDMVGWKDDAEWGRTPYLRRVGEVGEKPKIDFYDPRSQLLGVSADLRKYYEGMPGGEYIVARETEIDERGKRHVVKNHKSQLIWLTENGDLIHKAIGDPEIISSAPYKSRKKWSVTNVIRVEHEEFEYLVVGIRYPKDKKANELITTFLTSSKFIYDDNGELIPKWNVLKK